VEIENKSLAEIQFLVGDFPRLFREGKEGEVSLEDIVYLWNRIAAYILGKYNSFAFCDAVEFLDNDAFMERFGDLEGFCSHVSGLLEFIITSPTEKTGPNNDSFNNLLEYIEQNFDQKLMLKELCNRFYINLNYCCELFKKLKGTTFTDYLTSIRMKKASILIKTTELSIENIAYQTGYTDYYYFSRIFSKYFGISPARYKEIALKL
jgi:Response regulator containing CheY-like receiver domain and AraC-type DNA-binding domain